VFRTAAKRFDLEVSRADIPEDSLGFDFLFRDPQHTDVRSTASKSAKREDRRRLDVTQNVYNKTWWEERVEAVSMAAASVWREFMPTPQVPAAM
jgi:hypothetical protein